MALAVTSETPAAANVPVQGSEFFLHTRKRNAGRPLQIVSFKDELLIGPDKRSIRFDTNKKGEITPFGERCQQALAVLAQKQGAELKPHELWRAMYGENCPYDTQLMLPAIQWLETNAKLGRKKLVEWNGMRGRGSKYSFNSAYAPQYSQVDGTRKLQVANTDVVLNNAMAESADTGHTERIVRNKGYLFIAAHKLGRVGLALEGLGFDVIDPQLQGALKSHMPDLKALPPQERQEYHKAALKSVGEIVSQTDTLSELKDQLPKGSPEQKFIEYLGEQTNGADTAKLFSEIMNAAFVDGRVEHDDERAHTVKSLVAEDGRGRVLWSTAQA